MRLSLTDSTHRRLSILFYDNSRPQARGAAWEKTGIASLRDEQLSQIPCELLLLKNLRTADLGGNRLKELPEAFASLTGIQRLRLSHNLLGPDSKALLPLQWLSQLVNLSLDHNLCALCFGLAGPWHSGRLFLIRE